MEEVTPIEADAYIEYLGTESALETGYGFTCVTVDSLEGLDLTITLATNLEPFDPALGTGGSFDTPGQFAVVELDYTQFDTDRFVVLAVDTDDGVMVARCHDCVSAFTNDGTRLTGTFAGDFYIRDVVNSTIIDFGELNGDFIVPIEDGGLDCKY